MYNLYSHSPPFTVSVRVIGSMYKHKHKYVHVQKLLVKLQENVWVGELMVLT